MRDHVGEILGPVDGERLDPARRQPVHVRPPLARDLAVRDVANEHVAEDVGGLAGDRRAALPAHELLAFERVHRLLDVSVGQTEHLRASAPGQKTLPTMAAAWTSAFSSGGSVSSRAAMMPWTDSGSGSSSSAWASMRTYSSA